MATGRLDRCVFVGAKRKPAILTPCHSVSRSFRLAMDRLHDPQLPPHAIEVRPGQSQVLARAEAGVEAHQDRQLVLASSNRLQQPDLVERHLF